MSANVRELTSGEFDSAVSSGTVLVDFWATWCGPCRAQAPILEELAVEMAGKVAFCKVNIDDCMDLAVRFGIQSIPTLIVFKNGEPSKMFVGLQQAGTLKAAF